MPGTLIPCPSLLPNMPSEGYVVIQGMVRLHGLQLHLSFTFVYTATGWCAIYQTLWLNV